MKKSHLLDNRGTPCAVGLIRAAKTMQDLPDGTEMELLTKDRFAPMEVGLWVERDGYRLLRTERGGVWPFRYHRFVIEKPAAPTPDGSPG